MSASPAMSKKPPLQLQGWGTRKHGLDIAPDSARFERLSYADVVLVDRLQHAIALLNPHTAGSQAAHARAANGASLLLEENRRLHKAWSGVDVGFYGMTAHSRRTGAP